MKEILKSQAMKKFLHNKKAMFGLFIVVLLALAVLLIPAVHGSGSVHDGPGRGL